MVKTLNFIKQLKDSCLVFFMKNLIKAGHNSCEITGKKDVKNCEKLMDRAIVNVVS
jgi:hypothetical protein